MSKASKATYVIDPVGSSATIMVNGIELDTLGSFQAAEAFCKAWNDECMGIRQCLLAADAAHVPRIVEGTFALVTSGNCTTAWMLDGEDIQRRADIAMDRHWGSTSTVIRRGVTGFGVDIGGRYFVDIFTTHANAIAALAHTSKGQ